MTLSRLNSNEVEGIFRDKLMNNEDISHNKLHFNESSKIIQRSI